MATVKQRMEILGGVGLFSELTKRDLQRVAGVTREVSHPAGHTIVRQGASAHACHVIVEGSATVSINGRRRKGQILCRYWSVCLHGFHRAGLGGPWEGGCREH